MTPSPSLPMSDLNAWIGSRRQDWIGWLRDLVRIPSCRDEEQAAVDAIESRLTALSCTRVQSVWHDAERLSALPGAIPPFSTLAGRRSLVAVIPGRGRGRSLTLSSHVDTVGIGDAIAWTYDPLGAEIDGAGRLFGRGAMDDKAGVVITLAVADTVINGPLRPAGDLVLHFVLEDETTGNGTLLCLLDGPRTDGAFIIDGTRKDRAIRCHAGQLQGRVRVRGLPVSVSVSHLGLNATDVLWTTLDVLRQRLAALNVERQFPWTMFPTPFQFVVLGLHSDAESFTLPEAAEARFHVTFCPPWTLDGIRAALIDAARRVSAERGWPAVPELAWHGYSVEPAEGGGAELEAALRASVEEAGLPPVTIGPSTGSSDLRHFAAAGIPCLLYGPGSGQNPHRPDEHYETSDLDTMVRLYATLAARWSAAAGTAA